MVRLIQIAEEKRPDRRLARDFSSSEVFCIPRSKERFCLCFWKRTDGCPVLSALACMDGGKNSGWTLHHSWGCARWNVSCAAMPASPGWLHLLMPCVYLSQTRPKDTSGWYRGRMGGEAKGEGVWSSG